MAEVIENGYDGIVFAQGEQVLGIEWEDLFPELKRFKVPASSYKTDIRGMVVNEAKPGPNDPCPCGSGKKYKKCCGRG